MNTVIKLDSFQNNTQPCIFRTRNLYNQNLNNFIRIASKLSMLDECIGVVLGGGAGRGWYDGINSQDVDFYIFVPTSHYERYVGAEGANPNWPWVFDFNWSDYLLSVQFLDYDKMFQAPLEPIVWIADDHRWTQSNRWDKHLSKILIDSKNLVASLFKEKIRFPDSECIYMTNKIIKTINSFYLKDLRTYELRGLYLEANLLLSKCLHSLVHYIYVKRRRFIPPDKWLFWWLRTNQVQESMYWSNICECLVIKEPNTKEYFCERKNRFIDLCEKLHFPLNTHIVDENNTGAPSWLLDIFT